MKRFLPLFIIPLLLCTTCEDKNTFLIYGELTKKVLLIGVDGLSSTRLGEFNLPNHDRLIRDGLYEDGTTVNSRPSYSGPGWSSMITGVWQNKHGVTDNSFLGSNFEVYPPFNILLEQEIDNMQEDIAKLRQAIDMGMVKQDMGTARIAMLQKELRGSIKQIGDEKILMDKQGLILAGADRALREMLTIFRDDPIEGPLQEASMGVWTKYYRKKVKDS